MRFLVDENLSYRVCGSLKEPGHEAVHVSDVGLAGAEDVALMAWATKERSVIISCDHDFVQLLFESGDSGPSIVLTREVQTLPSAELGELLLSALSVELQELLTAGAIATLTRDRVRSARCR